MSKLLIVDTFGLIFRAYHAYPMLTTADGRPTNAIYGFLQMLLTTLEKLDPTHFAASLESKTPTFRHVLAQTYKANRKPADEEIKTQIAEVLNILETLNIKTLYKDGFEADDVIGSFATQNQDKFDEIQIVTGDRDLLQLLSPKIKILMPGKTFSDFVEYDRAKFEEKFGISLDDYVLYKSLIGDTSDNIAGIPGVGPKTAQKIVSEFHSIESVIANLDQLPPRIAESIIENQNLWKDYYKLSEIEKKIDSEITPDDTIISKLNVYKLRNIIETYELSSLQKKVAKFIDKFEEKHGGFALFADTGFESDKKTELKYILTDQVIFEDATGLSTSLSPIDSIGHQAFVHYNANFIRLGNGNDFVEVPKEDIFNFVINNQIKKFIGFDLKPFMKILLESGIEHIENYDFMDLKLAWYLIKSDRIFDDINDLVKFLDEDNFNNLYLETLKNIEESKTEELFRMEKDLQKVLAHMEYTGVCCDMEYLNKLEDEYKDKIEEIKKQMFDFVGHEFNPASTRELGHILFEVLNLPTAKKTKTGYSTDDSTLTKLEGQSEIIPMIKAFRTYSKALSTYVLVLKNSIDPKGRIHTTYSQAQVATGRLSSINPNLQNLPANEVIGKAIKGAFKPCSKDRVFLSFDYSQIDLRVLAYESKDPGLISAFQNDEDIHTATGRVVFDKEELTKQERNFAKTINFGIVYGMEPYGLSQALKIDQKSAKEFIDRYFEKFKGVKDYFDRITKQLDEVQYVNTFLGRKRYFPSWNKLSGMQKRILFREAINMPIQGGSSEIIKIAMNQIFEYLRSNKINADLILQVHDELIFEIDLSENFDKLKTDIQNIMVNSYDIGVPLKVSSKEGRDLTFVS